MLSFASAVRLISPHLFKSSKTMPDLRRIHGASTPLLPMSECASECTSNQRRSPFFALHTSPHLVTSKNIVSALRCPCETGPALTSNNIHTHTVFTRARRARRGETCAAGVTLCGWLIVTKRRPDLGMHRSLVLSQSAACFCR